MLQFELQVWIWLIRLSIFAQISGNSHSLILNLRLSLVDCHQLYVLFQAKFISKQSPSIGIIVSSNLMSKGLQADPLSSLSLYFKLFIHCSPGLCWPSQHGGRWHFLATSITSPAVAAVWLSTASVCLAVLWGRKCFHNATALWCISSLAAIGGDVVLGTCKIDVLGQTGARADVWLISLALWDQYSRRSFI